MLLMTAATLPLFLIMTPTLYVVVPIPWSPKETCSGERTRGCVPAGGVVANVAGADAGVE